MPNFTQNKFTRPETFRRIRPDLLLAWLKQWESYFAKRGLILPGADTQLVLPMEASVGKPKFGAQWNPSAPQIDYDNLVRVFMEPTPDMPAELADSLHLVREMGTARGMDAMLEECRARGVDLGLGDDASPEDVALKLWLTDPRMLENLQNCKEVSRPRGFQYFTTDASPLPQFEGPSLEQLRALEERLEGFYVAWRRGAGTRVFAYCQQRLWHTVPEWVFLVRHGAPFRREEAMENGEPTSVLYRPRKYAVLKYDSLRGELGVYCSAAREQKILLKAFGKSLFGREDFFPGNAKFNLEPIVRLGRESLACADVMGIEEVRLTEVVFYQHETPWRRTIEQADDIFALVEKAKLTWPKEVQDIASATFAVKLWRQKRARRVTIMPSNRAIYSRDEDSGILERWMEAREFIVPPKG